MYPAGLRAAMLRCHSIGRIAVREKPSLGNSDSDPNLRVSGAPATPIRARRSAVSFSYAAFIAGSAVILSMASGS